MRVDAVGDWYYIGHYGQLGPLTRAQIDELIDGAVIGRDTYVWRTGMADWVPASRVDELRDVFLRSDPNLTPPPPPSPSTTNPTSTLQNQFSSFSPGFEGSYGANVPASQAYNRLGTGVQSDRKRVVGGILQLLFPGVGRMYLGYLAYGVLQLVLTIMTCGVLSIWSFIDGIIILSGGLRIDGYGRRLED